MFAGAAREAVFSSPEVVEIVNRQFIPVAVKAAQVENPPIGGEGRLYAAIRRTRPAPQGICSLDAEGNVIAWALSFNDQAAIAGFLRHVQQRYDNPPRPSQPVVAERFRIFPSRKLPDVANERDHSWPRQHAVNQRCPGELVVPAGVLVGTVIGRAEDKQGVPLADSRRQEHYMEARWQASLDAQQQLIDAAQQAKGESFPLPESWIRAVVAPAYLGQLDVSPLGTVPGSQNLQANWSFRGRKVDSPAADGDSQRFFVSGESDVHGGPKLAPAQQDGRVWDHQVSLRWQGYVTFRDSRVVDVVMLATGREKLQWGNENLRRTSEPDVRHLMAGRAIDLDTNVRYALVATPQADNQPKVAGEPSMGDQIRQLTQQLRSLVQQQQQNQQQIRQLQQQLKQLELRWQSTNKRANLGPQDK